MIACYFPWRSSLDYLIIKKGYYALCCKKKQIKTKRFVRMLACIFSESNSQAVNITKFALSNRAILLFGSVVVSIEINRTTIGTKKVHLGDHSLKQSGAAFSKTTTLPLCSHHRHSCPQRISYYSKTHA